MKTVFSAVAGIGSLSASHKPRNPLRSLRTVRSPKTNVLVKVLGTAQDGGIPQIGCYCKNCQKARQDSQFLRLRSSLAIFDFKEKKVFIVDASPDISLQYDRVHERMEPVQPHKKNAPDGILLTHAHIGHYTGLMFYGYEALAADKLPVYCSRRMGDFLSNNGPWSQLVEFQNISIHSLEPDTHISLTPEISVTPFSVPHRDEYSDTLGFVIAGQKKKLLYIPDIQSWKAWDRDIREEVERVDFALLDGTFYGPEELPGRDLSQLGHPLITSSLDTLKHAAKKGETQIYFTHLNHSNLALDPDGDAIKHINSEGFGLAQEGMELSL
ncbi:MAG: MBL fold metallo-hydrolase [Candidatus Aminicenantaceae bacterium]